MAVSEAQKAATKNYNDAHYDKLTLRVPKGNAEIYKAFVAEHNTSLSALYTRLMDQEIARYSPHDDLEDL